MRALSEGMRGEWGEGGAGGVMVCEMYGGGGVDWGGDFELKRGGWGGVGGGDGMGCSEEQGA